MAEQDSAGKFKDEYECPHCFTNTAGVLRKGKSWQEEECMIQLYVKVEGKDYMAYLDTTKQRLMYNPIVYDTETWHTCTNVSTIFFYKTTPDGNGITLKSFVTMGAVAQLSTKTVKTAGSESREYAIVFLDQLKSSGDDGAAVFKMKAAGDGETGFFSLSTTTPDGEAYLVPTIPENPRKPRQRKLALQVNPTSEVHVYHICNTEKTRRPRLPCTHTA